MPASLLLFFRALLLLALFPCVTAFAASELAAPTIPAPLSVYDDAGIQGIWPKLVHRAQVEPFNVVATLIFFLAICHTFVASKFRHLSHAAEHEMERMDLDGPPTGAKVTRHDQLQFRATIFHFLGEVEAVFGIWMIPLGIALAIFGGWSGMVGYFQHVNMTEAVFVTVIMTLAATRPIIVLAEGMMSRLAALGKGTPLAWWFVLLMAGPILGSFITEPAAMTLCALLLSRRFYDLQPSLPLRYATLALLFVNISIGGTMTHFAAPPVVMVAGVWKWDMAFMFMNFGYHSLVAILINTLVYFALFRRELLAMKARPRAADAEETGIPRRIWGVHVLFIAAAVIFNHYLNLQIFILLFFLAFLEATRRFQDGARLRPALLVGFFLGALVIHGGCQQWWIEPVLGSLTRWPLMLGATALTAVNDNAAITYLATLVPNFGPELQHAVMAGALTGGGLTVIANAPNPAGQSLLQQHFGEDGISPLKLFLWALVPTVISGAALMLLP